MGNKFSAHTYVEETLDMLTGDGCLYKNEAMREYVLAKTCSEFQVFPNSVLMEKKPNTLHVMIAAALLQLDESEFDTFRTNVQDEHGPLFAGATQKTYRDIKDSVAKIIGEAKVLSEGQLSLAIELFLRDAPKETAPPAEVEPQEKKPPAPEDKPKVKGAVAHGTSRPNVVVPRPSNIDPLQRLAELRARQAAEREGGGGGGSRSA